MRPPFSSLLLSCLTVYCGSFRQSQYSPPKSIQLYCVSPTTPQMCNRSPEALPSELSPLLVPDRGAPLCVDLEWDLSKPQIQPSPVNRPALSPLHCFCYGVQAPEGEAHASLQPPLPIRSTLPIKAEPPFGAPHSGDFLSECLAQILSKTHLSQSRSPHIHDLVVLNCLQGTQ